MGGGVTATRVAHPHEMLVRIQPARPLRITFLKLRFFFKFFTMNIQPRLQLSYGFLVIYTSHFFIFFLKSLTFFNARQLYNYFYNYFITSYIYRLLKLRFFFKFFTMNIQPRVCNNFFLTPFLFFSLKRLSTVLNHYTLLKSPHVHKKARDQFAFRYIISLFLVSFFYFEHYLFFRLFSRYIIFITRTSGRVNILLKSSLLFFIKI